MAEDSLGRLLRREESISDLLAFLFAQDPEPLTDLLGLPPGRYTGHREHRVDSSERLDLVIRGHDGEPAAVLEIKAAAREHGDQPAHHETGLPGVPLFFVTLDRLPAPDPWRTVGLDELFGAWVGRPETGWLAAQVRDVLWLWQEQADGPIGEITGTYVPDILLRRLAAHLGPDLNGLKGFRTRNIHTGSTNGGAPQFMAWLRPEGYNGLAWVAVDLRCPPRGSRKTNSEWLFRPSIDAPGQDPSNDVLTEVHDIATRMREAMSHEAITGYLRSQGHADLAACLAPGRPRKFDEDKVSRWYELALGGQRSRWHPYFFQDAGRRLAMQFTLNVEKLDRGQLRQLIGATLQHLGAAMDKVGAGPAE